MRTIYLDPEFRCHVSDGGMMTAVETDAFDGCCDTYVEGYRYIPEGQHWKRGDGTVFAGPMVSPAIDYRILAAAQAQYERDMAEAEAAYLRGVNSV